MASYILPLAITILAAALATVALRRRAQHSQNGSVQIALRQTPNHATKTEIALLALQAGSKHIFAFIGCAARIKVDPRSPQRFKLPYISAQGILNIDENDERLYRSAVNSPTSGKTISPMFLVAQTLPLVVQILADPACPILPLGAVNTRDTFKVQDLRLARDIKSLREVSEQCRLSYKAAFGGADRPGHRRKRGMEFCVTIDILFDGTPVLTQELWFLQFLPASFQPRYPPPAEGSHPSSKIDATPNMPSQSFRIGTNDPAKWAASSNDYNPIHISTIGAKLFGFHSVIAHGNHVVAMAIEQLRMQDPGAKESSSPASRRMCWEHSGSLSLEVQFLRPMELPAEAHVSWKEAQKTSDIELVISRKGKVCIAGTLSYGD